MARAKHENCTRELKTTWVTRPFLGVQHMTPSYRCVICDTIQLGLNIHPLRVYSFYVGWLIQHSFQPSGCMAGIQRLMGIHVTVRHYRFLFNNQPDALIIQIYSVKKKTSCFGQLLCPSPGVFYCTFGIGKFHAGSDDRFHTGSGCNCSFILTWKRSSKTCMKFSNAECTVENSWWWAKKLPETCRVLWQNKFG
jgi:hypothetical protein